MHFIVQRGFPSICLLMLAGFLLATAPRGMIAAPIAFPPDTPTTATLIHTVIPNSTAAWILEAPHAEGASAIKFTASTTTTLALARNIYLIKIPAGGKILREGIYAHSVPANTWCTLQVGRVRSKVYTPRGDHTWVLSSGAASGGFASASASGSLRLSNYSVDLGTTGASAASAQGYYMTDSHSTNGRMQPGVTHGFSGMVQGSRNSYWLYNGSSSANVGVTFTTPHDVITAGTWGSSNNPFNAFYATLSSATPGPPLDDLDTIPAGEIWLLR